MAYFSRVSANVRDELVQNRIATLVERDPEWQRVNTYIAEALKDSHSLYSKLARLQGDFDGKELEALQAISEGVLNIGNQLSVFAKNFFEGKVAQRQDGYGVPEEIPVVTKLETVPTELVKKEKA